MKATLFFIHFVFLFTATSFGQVPKLKVWEVNTTHSVQTNGYRIPNNIFLTQYPTAFNWVDVSVGKRSGNWFFAANTANALVSDSSHMESDILLHGSYSRIFNIVEFSGGLTWIAGDVGISYNFLVPSFSMRANVADTTLNGVLTNLYVRSTLQYFWHLVNFSNQDKAVFELGGDWNLGKFRFATKVNYNFLRTHSKPGWRGQTWAEVGLKAKFGKLPFYVDFTQSLGRLGGAETNRALIFGVAFQPYKRKP